MRTITTVVMAHAQAQDTFDRHLPYWTRLEGKVMVFCPSDSVVATHLPVVVHGRRSHHDPMANARFKWLFGYLMNWVKTDWYIIHEYDSLCIGDRHPTLMSGFLHANAWTNTEPHRFKGENYFHPPLVMDRNILNWVHSALKGVPDEAEEGFWDRLLGLAVTNGKIPWNDLGAHGFSRNTIEPHMIEAAVAAKNSGATMFHGVKTAEVLRRITE